MELRVLHYFLAVAREENVTHAAQALHLSQPTLSRQLAQLEEELGVRLFERGKRKITLTAEGVLLRRRAKEILELAGKTERELSEQAADVEGTVAVGCGDLDGVRLLPELFRSFHARYPRVQFDLYTATADHIKERMESGLTDVGLLLEPVEIDRYEYIRMPTTERWVVTMAPDAPLTVKSAVTPEDLRGLPLILPRRSNARNVVVNWLGRCYDPQQVLFTSNLSVNSSVMVASGLAYSLNIEGTLRNWNPATIAYRPLDPPLQTSSVLAWRREQPFGLAAEKFIDYVKESMASHARHTE